MSIPLGSTVSTDNGNVVVAMPGIQGPPGSTWRSGVGSPDNSVGRDGDFYINTINSGPGGTVIGTNAFATVVL